MFPLFIRGHFSLSELFALKLHTRAYLGNDSFFVCVVLRLYTTTLDLKANNQDMIEVPIFNFNSAIFNKTWASLNAAFPPLRPLL